MLLTLDERPGEEILTLAARLAPGTPVVSVAGGSFPTAAELFTLEGKLNAATPRKAETALGLFERHVDTAALLDRISVARSARVTPMMFEHELLEQARSDRKRVVLPEGTEERVLRAADVLLRRDVCDLTLLGDVDVIRKKAADLGIDLTETQLIDPHTSELRQTFAERYAQLRAHRGVTVELAYDVVADVNYFGTLMVQEGLADGMVSGSVHSTAATIRPAFEIIKTKPDASIVSSVFFMCLADKVLVYGDCAVSPDPDAEQLADIAVQSAVTAARFGVEPRVAMLSYSTGTSGSGADVDKVREATERVRGGAARAAGGGADPVRRGGRAVRRGDEAAGLGGGRAGDRADLPGPEHRQQHLQGRAALGGRRGGRPGAPGSAQARQRPLARRARPGHRQHGGDHGDPGAERGAPA